MEKFSIKESMQDYETEIKTEKLYDLTKCICAVEDILLEDPVKWWREIQTLYEQITIAIDGLDSKSVKDNQTNFMIGWNENSPEQCMQYFMLNRIARSFTKNLLKMIKFGAFKVKEAAVNLISRFLVNVPSSAKKQ